MKLENSIRSVEEEIKQKEINKRQVEAILEAFKKEDYIGLFKREIEYDMHNIKTFQDTKVELGEEAAELQNEYRDYDKIFFRELEQ